MRVVCLFLDFKTFAWLSWFFYDWAGNDNFYGQDELSQSNTENKWKAMGLCTMILHITTWTRLFEYWQKREPAMRPFARLPLQFGQIPQDFGASLPPDIPDGWIQLVIWKLRAKSRTSVGSHNRKEENHQSYIWRLVHIVLIIWTWRQKQLWLGEPSKTT